MTASGLVNTHDSTSDNHHVNSLYTSISIVVVVLVVVVVVVVLIV